MPLQGGRRLRGGFTLAYLLGIFKPGHESDADSRALTGAAYQLQQLKYTGFLATIPIESGLFPDCSRGLSIDDACLSHFRAGWLLVFPLLFSPISRDLNAMKLAFFSRARIDFTYGS